MAKSTRFQSLTPEEKDAFLSDARSRHPDVEPTGPPFQLGIPQWHVGWGCSKCGWGFPLADVLVVDVEEPECPHCGAVGWFHVIPRRPLP
jgi:hypothetical protein